MANISALRIRGKGSNEEFLSNVWGKYTRAMGRFLNVVWMGLNITKGVGLPHSNQIKGDISRNK